MVMKLKPAIKKLKAQAKKLKKKALKLWNKNKYFRYTALAASVFTIGILIGVVFEIVQNGRTDTVSNANSQNEVSDTQTPGAVGSEVTPSENDITPKNLLKLTNEERSKTNSQALKINALLAKSAKAKCNDMAKKDYWAHNSPDGLTPWYFIEKAGYVYDDAGENLAFGYASSQGVIIGWMNSKTHKENLLNSVLTEVGFGICESNNYQGGPNTIIVQHLGAPATYSSTPQYTPEPYSPPVCKKTVIPFKTIYEEVTWLDEGETQEYGGEDGYIEKCTADSAGYKPPDFRIEPYDKTVYVGVDSTPQEEP